MTWQIQIKFGTVANIRGLFFQYRSIFCCLILDEDGLTVREIATGNTYEAVKAVTKQGNRKRWRIPWNNKTGWRYFEDKDIKACLLRKQIESLPLEEQHKRNNVEATVFQYGFHTHNGKTRYRGLLKHRMHAYSRCMWINLRRMVIFQISTFQRPVFALFGRVFKIRIFSARFLTQ